MQKMLDRTSGDCLAVLFRSCLPFFCFIKKPYPCRFSSKDTIYLIIRRDLKAAVLQSGEISAAPHLRGKANNLLIVAAASDRQLFDRSFLGTAETELGRFIHFLRCTDIVLNLQGVSLSVYLFSSFCLRKRSLAFSTVSPSLVRKRPTK